MAADLLSRLPNLAEPNREPGWVGREESATSLDMLAVTGLSYRQLDYWTRCGYLIAQNPNVGSGRQRLWDGVEQRIAEAMGRLIGTGMAVDTAEAIARNAVLEGDMEWRHQGVTIRVMVVA